MLRSLAFFLPHYRTDFALSTNRVAILMFPTLALPQTPAEVFPLLPRLFGGAFFIAYGRGEKTKGGVMSVIRARRCGRYSDFGPWATELPLRPLPPMTSPGSDVRGFFVPSNLLRPTE